MRMIAYLCWENTDDKKFAIFDETGMEISEILYFLFHIFSIYLSISGKFHFYIVFPFLAVVECNILIQKVSFYKVIQAAGMCTVIKNMRSMTEILKAGSEGKSCYRKMKCIKGTSESRFLFWQQRKKGKTQCRRTGYAKQFVSTAKARFRTKI